jgi:hypothetical protein
VDLSLEKCSIKTSKEVIIKFEDVKYITKDIIATILLLVKAKLIKDKNIKILKNIEVFLLPIWLKSFGMFKNPQIVIIEAII